MKLTLHIVLIAFFVVSVASLQAQEDNAYNDAHRTAYWAAVGIGSSRFGPCFSVNVSYAWKSNIVTVKYVTADEFRFNPGGADYDEPALRLREFGILYGRSHREGLLMLSLSAGIGQFNAVERGANIAYNDFEKVDISTIGVPFEAACRFEFGFVGIGGSWYGNINSKRTNSGGMIQLSIGVL